MVSTYSIGGHLFMNSKSVIRRRHGAELKAQVLEACNEPGASIAAVALAHGLNANLVRKWREGRGLKRSGLVAFPASSSASQPVAVPGRSSPVVGAQFVPVVVSGMDPAKSADQPNAPVAAQGEPTIHIELRRGPSSLTVHWPASASADCATWLRELAGGWLK
jgi:transposase